MAYIFISQATKDRDKAQALAAHLVTLGYSVWWDRDIGGGTSYWSVIEEEIDKSKVVLVCGQSRQLNLHLCKMKLIED